jgi:transcriptional regulator with XRE-family HTH domain
VVDAAPGSTVPRRQLGRYLRDARGRARMTVRAAAEALEWSEAKIWRIETGQTSLRSHDVEAMCRVYGTPATWTEALVGLAKQTKERGWWHAYGDVIPAWFDLYIGVQEAAADLRQYQSELVPGLLQTEDYARAVIANNPDVVPGDIDGRVALRMQRQALLTRQFEPPTCTFLLDEAVVRRPVGGPRAMADQCRRLAELIDLPTVTIRIVPFGVGLHAGILAGAFTLLHFPLTSDGRETEPPIVYIENLAGALYLERPTEIERYETAFNRIWRLVERHSDATTKDALWDAIRGLD